MSFPHSPDYPEVPPMARGIRIGQIGHYTSVDQFDFFRDWINWVNNTDSNVRIDPKDGTTIVWHHDIRLPLDAYLYAGKELEVVTEYELRAHFAPLEAWPGDMSPLFHRFASAEPTAATTANGTTESTVDSIADRMLNHGQEQ